MTADVDAVAVMRHGPRDPAHLGVRFQYGDVAHPRGLQLQCSGQPSRAGTDDDDVLVRILLAQAMSPDAVRARREDAKSSVLRAM